MKISNLFPRTYRRYRRTRKVVRYKILKLLGKLPPSLVDEPKQVSASSWQETGTIAVAVLVTGGLGDYLVIARVLRDLCAHVGNIRIHLFASSSGPARWAFKSVPEINGVFSEIFFHNALPRYDCAIAINQMAFYFAEHVNYKKLLAVSPKMLDVLEALTKSRPEWDTYIHHHPYLDGAMAHRATVIGANRYTLLHRMFGLASSAGNRLPLDIDGTLTERVRQRYPKWITVSNGFDAAFPVLSGRATKCYPIDQWNQLVASIKKSCPDTAIIQVGAKTSEPIKGVDLSLIGQTSLAQVASLIDGALLHIDNEGGLVHVAASLGRQSVVLFGPTSRDYFGYPENINLASGFCGGCWWSTRSWMEACPRKYEGPRCLQLLEPQQVAAAVTAAIAQIADEIQMSE